jgi:hypothetical protein
MVAKRRDDVALTALWQLTPKDLECTCGLVEELGGRLDNESPRMWCPGPYNSTVNAGCGTR